MEDFEESIIVAAVKTMTRNEVEVLHRMSLEDEELVCQGRSAYVGYHRSSPRTRNNLLRFCAITLAPGSDVGGFERYVINGTGKEILRRLKYGTAPEFLVVKCRFCGKKEGEHCVNAESHIRSAHMVRMDDARRLAAYAQGVKASKVETGA